MQLIGAHQMITLPSNLFVIFLLMTQHKLLSDTDATVGTKAVNILPMWRKNFGCKRINLH